MSNMNLLKIVGLVTLFSVGVAFAGAQGVLDGTSMKEFREYQDVGPFDIQVPTVVELPLTGFVERNDLALYDTVTDTFQPYLLKIVQTVEKTEVIAQSSKGTHNDSFLVDENTQTFVDYVLPEDGIGTITITLTASESILSTSLSVLLGNYVALPTSIEIRTKDEGTDMIVVAKKKMTGQTVTFLETKASVWEITLEYGQPLRIEEIHLAQNNLESSTEKYVRFLAQPESLYRIYKNPDRYVNIPTGESSNLNDDKDVLRVSSVPTQSNNAYTEADVDSDGIPDKRDNCVRESNSDQVDVNGNGRGDVCDDFDKDGRINSKDNCPNQPNTNQQDIDADGIGDVCDTEESRITEKYIWLPWAGMGIAALVVAGLFFVTIRGMKKKEDDVVENSEVLDMHINDDQLPRP